MANEVRCIVFVMTIIISGFVGMIFIPSPTVSQYTPHDPIHIEGDFDFIEQAANESWAGDGTIENPFIIEEYEKLMRVSKTLYMM